MRLRKLDLICRPCSITAHLELRRGYVDASLSSFIRANGQPSSGRFGATCVVCGCTDPVEMMRTIESLQPIKERNDY